MNQPLVNLRVDFAFKQLFGVRSVKNINYRWDLRVFLIKNFERKYIWRVLQN